MNTIPHRVSGGTKGGREIAVGWLRKSLSGSTGVGPPEADSLLRSDAVLPDTGGGQP